MSNFDKIAETSDSLIELLAAQCADLERLLALARSETAAAEQKNFEAVLEIVSERAQLNERLETFQCRIAELRGFLGATADPALRSPVTAQVAELASLILAQDRKNSTLLTGARQEAAEELTRLENSQLKINTYLSGHHKGLAYSRQF